MLVKTATAEIQMFSHTREFDDMMKFWNWSYLKLNHTPGQTNDNRASQKDSLCKMIKINTLAEVCETKPFENRLYFSLNINSNHKTTRGPWEYKDVVLPV